MGREDELALDGMGEISVEKSAMITSLPEVSYGRSREMAGALDIQELTGSRTGIRFVYLREYSDLNIFGGILRCDVLARGVLAAAEKGGLQVPLIVRLEGTNREEGRKILQNSGLRFLVARDMMEAANLVTQQVS